MGNKFSNAARGSFRGLIWLAVLAVALSISAYSLYYVARLLGVPKIFAMGFSTAFDGVALIAADKALQFAKEGKSGAFPRLVMISFAGLSAFLNSLHAILGNESPLAIPMWAGLPLAAVAAFEIHTSGERAKASARNGHAYPAPLPKYGGWGWTLFPLKTLSGTRDIVSARGKAITRTEKALVAVPALSAREANGAGKPEPHAIPARKPASERTAAERTASPEDTHDSTAGSASGASPSDAHASEAEAHEDAHAEAARPVTAIRSCALASCSRSFVPARRDARYCSGRCRAAASRAARSEREKSG
jgi:hypothetical protein